MRVLFTNYIKTKKNTIFLFSDFLFYDYFFLYGGWLFVVGPSKKVQQSGTFIMRSTSSNTLS